jgi:hypothetical protein
MCIRKGTGLEYIKLVKIMGIYKHKNVDYIVPSKLSPPDSTKVIST